MRKQFRLWVTCLSYLYFLSSFCIAWRFWQYLRPVGCLAGVGAFCLVFLSWLYPLGISLRRRGFWELGSRIALWGSFWLPGVVYASLLLLVWELARRLLAEAAGIAWASDPRNGPVAALGLGSLLFGILWAGYRKAQHPKIRRLFLPLHASPQGVLPLRVVVASDLHAEGFLQRQHLERVVHCIQRCKPDLVLLPGDLLDGPPEKLKEDGVEGIFRKLCAPYGVLACTGNHEFFVGIEEAVRLLTRCGIRVLREEFWVAEPGLVVVGREDFAGEYFPGGRKRRRLKEILAGVDPTLPVVVMDHRPRDLQEAAECGVDLMVCGHTHNGQFWPVSWIVRALFPVSYGYQKIGKTHVYVTSGAGTWGPPVRLGSSPEVVVFELTPGESSSKELAKETLPFG